MAEKKIDRTVSRSYDDDPASKRLRRTKDMLPGQYPGKEFYGGGDVPDAEWDDGRVAAQFGKGVKATSATFQRSRAGDRFSDLGDAKARVPDPETSDDDE